MKTKETFKIVMLPTEKASIITKHINGKSLSYAPDNGLEVYYKGVNSIPQHLYIISDDKIKEGDFYMNRFNQIHQASDINLTSQEEWNTCKKIVATTDKSLIANKGLDPFSGKPDLLPQIPESFIKAYIKAYNDEGKPITEVDLEYEDKGREEWWGSSEGGEPIWVEGYKLKTRPDNTVIVHQSKMYSRDEIIILFHKHLKDSSTSVEPFNNLLKKQLDNWISENL